MLQEPLFTNRPSTPSTDAMEEEDALLTSAHTKRGNSDSSYKRWREWGLFAWAFIATAAVVVLGVVYQHKISDPSRNTDDRNAIPSGKRNLIFMVSDGMGPASLALTRSWRQYTEQLPWGDSLVLDKHLIGQSRTRSSSSLVTDSAAGATAFSCGNKSYNGAISVLPSFEPCGSVMEAAKRLGYTTGLVVTTRITDATPAVFASHVRRREMEDEIALQMIGESGPLGRSVDLMFGGGRCHFLPNTTAGSCRDDDVDVLAVAGKKELGWQYIDDRRKFDNLGSDVDLPLLGLFALEDIPYEIDRRTQQDKYPSLEEMTKTALRALSAATQDSEQGFFVMIEGSRIDHAGHGNDPAAQVHEVLAYDHAMAAVLDFIENDAKVPTLMVSTSDHETGGLALARQLHETYPAYLWYPGVLANASHSSSYTSSQYHHFLDQNSASDINGDSSTTKHKSKKPHQPKPDQKTKTFLTNLLSTHLGIQDPSPAELSALLDENAASYSYIFADMVSRRAQTGWSTHGHGGVDVNIYSSDARMASDLVGNHENTDVGLFLKKFLGAEDEVDKVTGILREWTKTKENEGVMWLGGIPGEGERLDGQDHLDHYGGDHRRRRRSGCNCGL